MKKRVCGAIAGSLILLISAQADGPEIFQGYQADGVLIEADEMDIFQGYLIDGVLVDGEMSGARTPQAQESFTVYFDPNCADATVDIPFKVVTNGKAYGELPVPVRSGYVFRGWYTGTAWVSANTLVSLSGDQTLYAQWNAAAYRVTFDATGGFCATGSKFVAAGGTYGDLPVPTREGCRFDGWYTAPNAGVLVNTRTSVVLSGDHTLYAHWTVIPAQIAAQSQAPDIQEQVFADVPVTSNYFNAVGWAVQRGITSGTSPVTFSPNDPCKRKYILTFLWRANGSPDPGVTDLSESAQNDALVKGCLWAFEKSLITRQEYLTREDPSTRADTVTYLWKLAGSPSVSDSVLRQSLNRFQDVPAESEFAQAVAWAMKLGITKGTTDTTFSPDRICTRGQIVTFLYRCYSN